MKTIKTKAAFFESDSSRVELKRNGQVLQPSLKKTRQAENRRSLDSTGLPAW
jgi:hypothetical protein